VQLFGDCNDSLDGWCHLLVQPMVDVFSNQIVPLKVRQEALSTLVDLSFSLNFKVCTCTMRNFFVYSFIHPT
jgi:hypothetical protein